MSKSEFAAHMSVSKAAVSQWLAKDIISPDALWGEGRSARIIVARAMDQVRRRRDIGQSLGNGIGTGAKAIDDDGGNAVPTPATPDPVDADDPPLPEPTHFPPSVEDQLKQARLDAQNFTNRKLAEEEALRAGQLMSADAARAEMSKIAGRMMAEFEGALPDLATAIAARFSIPHRDVLHLVRAELKTVRARIATKHREAEARLPGTTGFEIKQDEDADPDG